MAAAPPASGLRRVAGAVAALNLGYFGIEFAVALTIGSVSLFADSVDFLEDASVNLLIVATLGWSVANRARVGMAMAGFLLVPGIATPWKAWAKLNVPVLPTPLARSLAGAGALMECLRLKEVAINPHGMPQRRFVHGGPHRADNVSLTTAIERACSGDKT